MLPALDAGPVDRVDKAAHLRGKHGSATACTASLAVIAAIRGRDTGAGPTFDTDPLVSWAFWITRTVVGITWAHGATRSDA